MTVATSCPACTTPLPPAARFCPDCGAPVGGGAVGRMADAARVLGSLPVGVVVVSAEPAVRYANATVGALFGRAPEALLGPASPFLSVPLYGRDGRLLAPGERPVAQAAATGQAVRNAVVGLDLPGGGGRVWLRVNCVPLSDDDGAGGVITTLWDYTAARQAEERFARIFETSPYAVAVVRMRDEVILDVNPMWERMYGYRRDEAVGCSGLDLGLYAGPSQHTDVYREMTAAGAIHEEEVPFVTKAGDTRLAVFSSEYLEMDGEFCCLATSRDITDRKAQQERADATERLATLGRVAAGVAHEFNNALAGIIGRLDLLALSTRDPALRDQIATIEATAEAAAAVVARVQGYAGLRAHGRLNPVPVADLVGEVLASAYPRVPHAERGGMVQVALQTSLQPDMRVLANRDELRDVLLNLVRNALDAAGESGTIAVEARPEDDAAVIRVRDNGPGMDPATLARVFEPFFTTKSTASGLGLTVARDIVRRHGGTLTAESTPGAGTTFTVRLALAEPAPAAG